MAKDRINLLLDREAIERARRYSELHGTSISALVSDLLSSLPAGGAEDDLELTPTVRRLLGLAGQSVSRHDYRDHLIEKHRR